MIRALLLAPVLLLPAACGRSDGPDEPLYVIDQSEPAVTPDPALEGCWVATLTTTVEPRTLVLDVTLSPERVRLVSPDQGGGAVVFDQVRLDGRSLSVATRLGAFRFSGRLDGPDRLVGEVVQGGLTDRLGFDRRAGDASAC